MGGTPLTLKYDDTRNWGDALAPWLLERLCGQAPECIPLREACERPNLLTVGSVLRMADARTTVWGSGFISATDGLGLDHWREAESEVRARPAEVRAVRGPRTREKLLSLGVTCPEVYGDPALLLPRLLPAASGRRFELGVVPHYSDRKHPALGELRRDGRVKVIDVRVGKVGKLLGRPDLGRFVRELTSCDKIVSSSLHGLVVAEAYGIPSQRALMGEEIVGGDFKFEDFLASVGREGEASITLDRTSTRQVILDRFRGATGRFDPAPLLAAAPFELSDL